jgi:beta-phosphoglucomutase-like phosphatase (HAD superfamily)
MKHALIFDMDGTIVDNLLAVVTDFTSIAVEALLADSRDKAA